MSGFILALSVESIVREMIWLFFLHWLILPIQPSLEEGSVGAGIYQQLECESREEKKKFIRVFPHSIQQGQSSCAISQDFFSRWKDYYSGNM